ncbi:MAG: restriction endonuclease subunit S [Neptuniibacter sp.]
MVPQDPNDEPASVLLERIAEERDQLVKEKKIKKQKKLPEISVDEIPFPLPAGWVFSRLGELINSIQSGGTPSKRQPEFWEGDIPWASVKDLGVHRVINDTQDHITQEGLDAGSKLANEGDILICTRMGLGKIAVCGRPIAINQDLKAVKLSTSMDLDFFLVAYSTLKIEGTGTTVAGIKQEELLNYPLGIPPVTEQKRIVAKVDELMALCDQLEEQTENNITSHQVLVETLLGTLTQSQNADELSENWQRLAEHFDTLFTTEHSIDQLKQTILQLAVMGKLVPQDPNDEPASVLLERIATEKEQLIKDKKIKKQKPLPSIIEDEKLFGLPKGWEWTRFGEIFFDLKYGTSEKSDYGIDGQPILRIPNVVNGYVSTKDLKFSKLSEKAALDLKLSIGDLLIIRSNGSVSIVGKSTVIDREMSGFGYAGYLVRARLPQEMVLPRLIKLMLDSSFVREQIEKPVRTTSGVKNVNSTELGQLKMPVMSLPEQHRIVAKVDQLILLCDQLKARLQESQQTQLSLAEAITDQALQG